MRLGHIHFETSIAQKAGELSVQTPSWPVELCGTAGITTIPGSTQVQEHFEAFLARVEARKERTSHGHSIKWCAVVEHITSSCMVTVFNESALGSRVEEAQDLSSVWEQSEQPIDLEHFLDPGCAT